MDVFESSTPILDTSVIQDLSQMSELGDQFVCELLSVFLGSTSEMCLEIRAAIKSSDQTKLKSVCHSNRSASAQVGAMQLAEILWSLESYNGGPQGLTDLEKKLQKVFERTVAALKFELFSRSKK
jgi:HPt (histidine-containing phosphotransfer) domain-containing protein